MPHPVYLVDFNAEGKCYYIVTDRQAGPEPFAGGLYLLPQMSHRDLLCLVEKTHEGLSSHLKK